MRSTAVAIAVAVLFSAGGCRKKAAEKNPATAASDAGTSRQRAGRTGDRPVAGDRRFSSEGAQRESAEAVNRLRMLPIAVAEVESSVPVLPDGVATRPPTLAMGGRQVRATQCVTGRTTTQVAADLSAELTKQGFTAVRSKPHPRDAGVVLISGEKTPLRVGGSVQRGDFADCSEARGGTRVTLSYFKRAAAEDTPAPGSTTP